MMREKKKIPLHCKEEQEGVAAGTGRSALLIVVLVTAFLSLPSFTHAEAKALTPIRASLEVDGYTVNIAPDKKHSRGSDRVRFFVKVTDAQHKKIKPSKIFLSSADGKKHDAKHRQDHQESTPKGKSSPGFPSVGTSFSGMGMSMNLGGLLGAVAGGSPYSHTSVEFDKKDFASDAALVIVLSGDGKKEISIPIPSISE